MSQPPEKMPDTYSQQICPSCGGHQFTKAGSRRLKSGEKRQLYRCVDCNKRFSSRNRTGKNTDPRAILKAVELVCLGHGYEEILLALKREYGVTRSKSALSRWISGLPLPWLEIRDGFSIDGQKQIPISSAQPPPTGRAQAKALLDRQQKTATC